MLHRREYPIVFREMIVMRDVLVEWAVTHEAFPKSFGFMGIGNSPYWNDGRTQVHIVCHLAFREYLMFHPGETLAYGKLKWAWPIAHPVPNASGRRPY